jgi:alkylation response protein AidB-like acyl-CoA dehydrogenase
MNFDLSDLQRMLLDSAERYLGDHFTLEHRRHLRQSGDGLDHEAWATFAELGWLSILVPEELGGLGAGMTDAAVLAGVLGQHCVTQPFASSAILAPTILSGVQAPPTSLIGDIVAGTVRIALADAEPGERHAGGQNRQATLSRRGGNLLLDGSKMMVCDAPSATHLIGTAQGESGLVLLLVPADHAGVSMDGYPLLDGTRAADVRFSSVVLEPAAVLAEGTLAEELLGLALDRTRVIHAAQSVGSMEASLEICSAYLKERQQFGQPIGNFQALQHIMADMFVATHQARSMLYFALSGLAGASAGRRRAVALAKLHIAEAAQLVARQAIQLHGGYGVTDEYEVSHHYRRQMVLEKLHGDLDRELELAGG